MHLEEQNEAGIHRKIMQADPDQALNCRHILRQHVHFLTGVAPSKLLMQGYKVKARGTLAFSLWELQR